MIGRFIVSRLSGIRVYPQVLPQDVTLPAVTYNQISRSALHAFGGDRSTRNRVQIDVWAEGYSEVRSLAAEVKERLSRYRGENVRDVFLTNEFEGFEDGTRRVTQEYIIYEEE